MFLDPLSAIGFTGVFAAVALLTMRRPVYGVCTLILVEPFALAHDAFDTTITLSKVALLGALLGVSAYRNGFAPVAERTPWRLVMAGVFVLAATLLTFAQAAYHAPVIREALKTLEYVVLFCVVVAAYRLEPERRPVSVAILTASIAVAILALAQELIGAPSVVVLGGHTIARIAGPLEGPNQLAGYFDVALPVAFALAIDRPSPLAHAALFFIIFADVLTLSRGGGIGAVAAILAVALAARKNLRAGFVAMGCGLAAGLAAFGILAQAQGFLRFLRLTQPVPSGGVGTRPELWHAAIALWKQHPIFGIGAGNFEREIPLTGLRGVRTHANSLYLQSLVEGGLPLLAATLWLVFTSIATFARDRLSSPFVLAAFAASIALALHQVVDFLTFYPKIGGEWWIVMALGAAELGATARVRSAWAA